MNLKDFPNAIASSELAHLTALQEVRRLAEAVEVRKSDFGASVACDSSLTNEARRKAARAELELTDPTYLKLLQSLSGAKDAATEAQIEVERLKRLFTVEKLLTEDAIASKRAA